MEGKSYNQNLKLMLSINKMLIFVFVIISVFLQYAHFIKWNNIIITNQIIMLAASFVCLLFITYALWYMLNKMDSGFFKEKRHLKLRWLSELIIFMVVISVPEYMEGSCENDYKYIFLILILAFTIEYGLKYGLITAIISSINILGVDLLYAPLKDGVNIYFQKDIITSGVFIIASWILGYYADFMFEIDRKKEVQLSKLHNTLEQGERQKEELKKLLFNNENCYDLCFENSSNAIILHDSKRILYANNKAQKMFDIRQNEDFEYVVDNGEIYCREKYSKILNEKLQNITEEEQIKTSDGKELYVKNISSYFIYEGHGAVLTVLIDMTPQKKIENLEQHIEENMIALNKEKEFNEVLRNFFYVLSHEIKTPLNLIYSGLQATQMEIERKKEEYDRPGKYIEMMKINCLRMTKLINNFMYASKVESKMLILHKQNKNIVESIENIVQYSAEYVKDKNIQIIFDTDVEEKIMSFDKEIMDLIMLNLLSNSIKYSFKYKFITVNIKDKKDKINIAVKDKGIGIPNDKIDLVFEKFGQVNASMSRNCEGIGLGLYLVKNFVKLHNGNININSDENKGCEVVIELPVEINKDEKYVENILDESYAQKIEREFSDIYTI